MPKTRKAAKILGDRRGLTLLEVVISLSLLGILLTIAIMPFKRAGQEEALKKDRQGLVAILEEARSLSLAAKQADAYGVRVEADRAILFKGASYAAASDNKVQQFHSTVQATSTSFAGSGQEVVFSRLNGATANFGTVKLFVVNDPLSSTTVTVKSTGVIE